MGRQVVIFDEEGKELFKEPREKFIRADLMIRQRLDREADRKYSFAVTVAPEQQEIIDKLMSLDGLDGLIVGILDEKTGMKRMVENAKFYSYLSSYQLRHKEYLDDIEFAGNKITLKPGGKDEFDEDESGVGEEEGRT